MQVFKVNSTADLYNLKERKQQYNKIVLDGTFLHANNLLRYGLKYSLWNIPVGGEIQIFTNPHKSFGFLKNYVDFWQTSVDIGVAIGNSVDITKFDKPSGEIVLKKTKELYNNNGVTLAIVFSGNDNELDVMEIALKSLLKQNKSSEILHEIVLCGPEGYDLKKFDDRGVPSNSFTYLVSEIETSPRIMITKKKNDILRAAKYNIVSISHGRISFPDNYLEELYNRKMDLITPKVEVTVNGQNYAFLDLGLIGSYDIYKAAIKRSISGAFIKKDYLSQLKHRVPYIEGSVTVFNTNTCKAMYSENVAWGEAEDIEISARAYYEGALLDYFNDVVCKSNTMKYNVKLSSTQNVKFKLVKFLVDQGLI